MKLHKRYLMPMESLDEFCNYLQIKLEKDFCFDDDTVISTMERSMEELKRAKLDYPGAPLPHELPRYPFGTFQEPTFTNKVLLQHQLLALLSTDKYQKCTFDNRNIIDVIVNDVKNQEIDKTQTFIEYYNENLNLLLVDIYKQNLLNSNVFEFHSSNKLNFFYSRT